MSDQCRYRMALGSLCWHVATSLGILLLGVIEASKAVTTVSSIEAQTSAYAESSLAAFSQGRHPQRTDTPGDASEPERPERLHHLPFRNCF